MSVPPRSVLLCSIIIQISRIVNAPAKDTSCAVCSVKSFWKKGQKAKRLQNPRRLHSVCRGFCRGQAACLSRLLRRRARPVRGPLTAGRCACPAGWRARPVRGSLTVGRCACPAGWRARPVRGSLTVGRCACPAGYSGLSGGYSRRARTSRGSAPQRASQGEGRATPPLMLSPPLLGAIILGARQYVRRKGRAAPIPWTQPRGRCGLYKCRNLPHCSRRSRTKFFAEAFFQKGRKVFCQAFFQKGRKVFCRSFFSKKQERRRASSSDGERTKAAPALLASAAQSRTPASSSPTS